MQVPIRQIVLWVVGGICVGWGSAHLTAKLAIDWSSFNVVGVGFLPTVPIWLWGALLLFCGGLLILMGAMPNFADHTKLTSPKVSASETEILPQSATPESTTSENPSLQKISRHNGSVPEDISARAIVTRNTFPQSTSFPDSFSRAPVEPHAKEAITDPALAEDTQPIHEVPQAQSKKINGHRPKKIEPKIVAIGGGTGMPQLLRGLRHYSNHITAIVTVADDGGSSGRLRNMGILPPGDFRNNIAALSESEDLTTRLFQYRFPRIDSITGDEDKTGLAGHNFGNIFIATMAAVTGSFESGLAESSRVLAVQGRVLPSTLEQVVLCAEVRRATDKDGNSQDGESQEVESQDEFLLVEGESRIPDAHGKILRVFLKPEQIRAYPEAIRAILQADLIIAGPGSFFTSVIPNLLVPDVREAILASSAPSVYICNIATQPGETDHYDVSEHMLQLYRHAGQAFTAVLANDNYNLDTVPSPTSQWVTLPRNHAPGPISDTIRSTPIQYHLFTGDLVSDTNPTVHDPKKLSQRVFEIYQSLT
ncbi:MAG: gluconeogenesis factor YvcK family protein [Chloroflexota bacterium]